jgi:hypothetical protein
MLTAERITWPTCACWAHRSQNCSRALHLKWTIIIGPDWPLLKEILINNSRKNKDFTNFFFFWGGRVGQLFLKCMQKWIKLVLWKLKFENNWSTSMSVLLCTVFSLNTDSLGATHLAQSHPGQTSGQRCPQQQQHVCHRSWTSPQTISCSAHQIYWSNKFSPLRLCLWFCYHFWSFSNTWYSYIQYSISVLLTFSLKNPCSLLL